MAASSKALSSQYRDSRANQTQRIRFGRTRAGSMSHRRKRHGSHLSVTQRLQRPRSFKSPSNRCRLERALRPRTPTASKLTRNLSLNKPLRPSYRSPSNVAMGALSTPRSSGPAHLYWPTALVQKFGDSPQIVNGFCAKTWGSPQIVVAKTWGQSPDSSQKMTYKLGDSPRVR